jgi:hypothetical protein
MRHCDVISELVLLIRAACKLQNEVKDIPRETRNCLGGCEVSGISY